MTSATMSEERPAYDVLARKTVEILDVVNSTRQLLIEKYNNDQTMWLEALFRILMIKNPIFLVGERNSSVRDPNVHKILRDQMLEMYRVMDDQNPQGFDPNLRDQFLETGCNLISIFRVFTNFLLQTKLDVAGELANLQFIANNIEKYVQRCSSELEKTKSGNEQNKVKSAGSEPEKVMSIRNDLEKVKPATSELVKVKPAGSEQEKVKSVGIELEKVKAARIEAEEVKPAASIRNINDITFGPEAIELALKTSVMNNEKRSTTPAKVGANDRLCEVCNDPITIFNNDEEFSVSLHEQKMKHKKAVKRKMVGKDVSQAENVLEDKNTLPPDENTIRMTMVDLVGPVHARFFRIDAWDEFFCSACECNVYSMHNVVTHVQGRNHTKNVGVKSHAPKEPKSGSDSRDLTSDEVDSAEDDVFRVGSTIPIKSLF